MTIGDSLGNKAKEALDKAGGADKVKGRLGTAAEKVDSVTGGKLHRQIDKGEQAARSAVDKLDQREQQ